MLADIMKRNRRWAGDAFIVVCICVFAKVNVALGADPTVTELVDRYHQAATCWDMSVAMQVKFVHSYSFKSTDRTDIRRWEYDTQHWRDGNRCAWFGRCRFEGELDGEKYSHTRQFRDVVGDDFVLYYSKRDSEEEPEASMGSDVEESRFILQAQGPDGGFLQGRIPGIGLAQTVAEVMRACDTLRLVDRETLNGVACFVVEAKARHGTFAVWLAPEKGYNALKYTVRKDIGDILRDDIRVEDQGITECVTVIDAIEVTQIDGVFVPISGRQRSWAKAGEQWESSDYLTAERSEVVLSPDFSALDAFMFRLPEGTTVTHSDVPNLEFRWVGGMFVPDLDEYIARRLKGKPLPNLDGIAKGLGRDSFAGKPVLVCLWDMQQRPSRHQIIALRDKAQKLEDQSLAIISIQAAKVEQRELEEWVTDNDIPFALGMIADRQAKTRNNLGVRSLPWLILTDATHRVVAEGFSLDDLDNELKKLGDN